MSAASWKQPSRIAWQDRFERPEEEQWLEHYNAQLRGVFTATRERLLGLGEMTERMDWMGAPWHWCLLINPADLPEERDRSWAYLTPAPEAPLLIMPVDLRMVDRLPMRRIKKHVRECVAKGKTVGQVTYAEWAISAKTQLEDIMEMVNRLYKLRQEDPLHANAVPASESTQQG